ncbi:C-terminal domain of homeodomain 1-domain-containing protein [Mycena galopus ATCC 62051]|nr:C-terminal domain of homeodomain 1-domain-containing protein [Mycena galopus ATCC 62051]
MASLSIHQRLLDIERDLAESPHVTPIFEQKWGQLCDDIESATHAGILDEDTKALTYHVASRVAIAAELEDQLNASRITVSTNLANRLESLELEALARDDAHTSSESELDSTPAAPSMRQDPSLPPYIEPAYKWLLKHLYDPYPKKAIKEKIADETGSSIERISDWFVDVRRRMGWTTLLREDFGRKRVDLIDAAKRYFLGTNDKHPLPVDIHGKFVQMEAFAHDMYAAKFVPSALSNKLTAAVKDLTPELQEKARLERLQKLQAQREAAKLGVYPSPAPSGASSPTSDAGRKRSYSEASDDDDLLRSKRSRNDDGAFALPSPPYSSHSSPTTRKRRLSDTGAPSAKRPRTTTTRIVSDPIVVTLSGTPDILADWFSSDSQGDTSLFEPGQLLDIKFFDPAEFNLAAAEDEEPEQAAAVQPVIQTTMLPSTSNTVDFSIPADAGLDYWFNTTFLDGSVQQPPTQLDDSDISTISYPPLEPYLGPSIWQSEPQALLNPFTGTYDSNINYISHQNFAEPLSFESYNNDNYGSHNQSPQVYSHSLTDGKTAGNFIAGILGQQQQQQHEIQNDYTAYQQPLSY